MVSVRKKEQADPKWVAATGIDFEGLNPPVHINKGEPIPEEIPQHTLNELKEIGAIKEAE